MEHCLPNLSPPYRGVGDVWNTPGEKYKHSYILKRKPESLAWITAICIEMIYGHLPISRFHDVSAATDRLLGLPTTDTTTNSPPVRAG
jgi:hypothetical protein